MLVYFTVILAVMLGFCGLAIDVGRMELRTLQLQAAADDGAMTAAAELQRQNASWQTAAGTEVNAFLTQANLPNATTNAHQYATAGPYGADNAALEVTVTQQLPLYFLGLVLGSSNTTLTARGVALLPPCSLFTYYTGGSPTTYAVYLASANFDSQCPTYVNQGIDVDYFARMGWYQTKVTGSPAQSGEVSGQFPSPPIYNAPVISDPLSYVTSPVFSSCTYTGGKNYTLPATMNPGTYCGGVVVNATTVTMNPGLYIITGGMSVINGATLTGTGVTMFFTKGGGSGYGTFKLYGGSTMKVSAPIDSSQGGVPAVVIFGDRNWNGGQQDFQFNSSTYKGDGVIYLTNTGVNVQYSSLQGNNYFMLDVASLYEYAYCTINPSTDFSSLPGGTPFHIPVRLLQ